MARDLTSQNKTISYLLSHKIITYNQLSLAFLIQARMQLPHVESALLHENIIDQSTLLNVYKELYHIKEISNYQIYQADSFDDLQSYCKEEKILCKNIDTNEEVVISYNIRALLDSSSEKILYCSKRIFFKILTASFKNISLAKATYYLDFLGKKLTAKNENLLTKLFSIEYSIWFEYLLFGLYHFNLPLPLGGTSNHFKMNALKKLGYWDAYNVTEDADLGIRIFKNGYKTAMIDSYTLEESIISVKDWCFQRTRWIKGFCQVLFVYLQNNKLESFKNKFLANCSIIFFICLANYCFFIPPILMIFYIKSSNVLINTLISINVIFSLSYSYGSAYIALVNQSNSYKNFKKLDIIAIVVWPFYFILHSFACYLAIFEIFFAPFRWNKTIHGNSKIKI